MSNQKKKILVLGATGMAGHVVYTYLNDTEKYQMTAICHTGSIGAASYALDIYDTDRLIDIIHQEKPDYVINCIGILIRGSKQNPANAIYINAYFPHLLSKIVHDFLPQSKVCHISTDCVFSGKTGGYKDTDQKDALDMYGMSKNLGELINDKDVTLRTSIIGPELKEHGEGLVHWVFGQRKAGTLNGYKEAIWGGVTTLELAKVIDAAIDKSITGLYQISNNIGISKYDLISMIVKEFELPISVVPVEGIVCDKSIINTVSPDFAFPVSSYEKMIRELHGFMQSHKEIYTQYLGD